MICESDAVKLNSVRLVVLLCIVNAFQAVGVALPTFAQIIVAHRGASSDAPENSINSFKLAWEQDADAVEGDFFLTLDKQIVCIHDDTTTRVSGVELKVAESSLAALQKLDIGSWKGQQFRNERIPTLQEVLAVIPPKKTLFIEIKCGPEILPYLKPVLTDSDVESQQLRVISFNKDVIRTAKLVMPSVEAYWLVDFRKDNNKGLWYPEIDVIVEAARRIGADGVDVRAKMDLLNPNFVERCREAGLSLHAWTVDDPSDAMRLRQLGFDSITTNRPGFLREVFFLSPHPQLDTIPPVTPQLEIPALPRTEDKSPADRIKVSTE